MRKRKGVLTRSYPRDSVGHACPHGLLVAVVHDPERQRMPGCAGRSDRRPDRSCPASLHFRVPGHSRRRARRPALCRDPGSSGCDSGGRFGHPRLRPPLPGRTSGHPAEPRTSPRGARVLLRPVRSGFVPAGQAVRARHLLARSRLHRGHLSGTLADPPGRGLHPGLPDPADGGLVDSHCGGPRPSHHQRG